LTYLHVCRLTPCWVKEMGRKKNKRLNLALHE